MTKVRIKGVRKTTVKGIVYYYAWRGKDAPRLIGKPGSPEFLKSYLDAHAARKGGDGKSIAGLVTSFKACPAWQGKGPKPISQKTKDSWRPWVEKISDHFGELPIAAFDRPQMRPKIIRWRDGYSDTPRAADMGVQVLSRILSFGMMQGELMNNICFGLPQIYANDRSDMIWTEADLARLQAEASPEVYMVARLAALCGIRKSDLLKLQWGHVKANSIEVTTGKSGNKKTTLVPLYGDLRAFLETIPKRSVFVLTNTDGVPWASGYGSSFAKACDRAADRIKDPTAKAAFDELHFHDLRGTAATRFFMAGLTTREIAEIMTWSEEFVNALIDRYVRREDLLRDRIRRMDEAGQ